MKHPLDSADSYSSLERKLLRGWRQGIAFLFRPFLRILVALRASPNFVSFLQIPIAILFLFVLAPHPRFAFLFFIGSLLVDALDGALARKQGATSSFGAFFDQVCDYTRETIVIAALALNGALVPFLAVLYPAVYGVFNLILYMCNAVGKPVPFAIKSYLVFYPALFLYLWFELNWLDVAVSLSIFCMLFVIVVGLARLSRAPRV